MPQRRGLPNDSVDRGRQDLPNCVLDATLSAPPRLFIFGDRAFDFLQSAALAAAMSSSASSASSTAEGAAGTERSLTVAPVGSRSMCASLAESAAAFAASTRA